MINIKRMLKLLLQRKESELSLPARKPGLMKALRLQCPYCGREPLLKPKSWFEFRGGCPQCGYRYEREEGYFTGASWMVNFPVTSMLAFILAWALVVNFPDINSLVMAAAISVLVILFGIAFFPFSMALWMWLEHFFHPLNKDDVWQPEANHE